MNFAELWGAATISQTIQVSDGNPPPPEGSPEYWMWRSHNFTGVLTAKDAGEWRSMSFQLAPNETGSVITYTINLPQYHTFEIV